MTSFRTNKNNKKYPITPKKGKSGYNPPKINKDSWKKVDKSFWDERENPHSKKILIYRKGEKSSSKEIVVEELNQDGMALIERMGHYPRRYAVIHYGNTTGRTMLTTNSKTEAINEAKMLADDKWRLDKESMQKGGKPCKIGNINTTTMFVKNYYKNDKAIHITGKPEDGYNVEFHDGERWVFRHRFKDKSTAITKAEDLMNKN